jgi:Putative amidoligase enzyme
MSAATPLSYVAGKPKAAEATEFRMPPRLTTDDGRPRRVGVEIEFAGLSVAEAGEIVTRLYGGELSEKTRFISEIAATSLGDFRVEIDSMPLKKQSYKAFLEKMPAGESITSVVEDVMEAVVRTWVPTEIVTAPILLEELSLTERLRWALMAEDAEGTRKSVLYGFGFQLNPELPGLDADTMCRHLRAFLVLYDWLLAVIDVDATRAYSPFVDAFPIEYRRKLLTPGYAPDLDTLIGDYLAANPTRNRPLDMLPAFAMLRKELVLSIAKEHDQVKPRPTFHYRLPNCLIDDPSWSFALEWNRWVEVERLAADPRRLDASAADVLRTLEADEKPTPDVAIEQARSWGITTP